MKRIITLLLIGMLAFSAFAADYESTLYIEAKVAEIVPTFILKASTTDTFADEASLNLNSSTAVTLKTGTHRFTRNVGNTEITDDNSLTVYFALYQNESRYAEDVSISLKFTTLKYIGNGDTNVMPTETATDKLEGNYETELPTVEKTYTRDASLGLIVSDIAKDTTKTATDTVTYKVDLDYSIFGYFIKSGEKLSCFKATYMLPSYDGTTKYMPFGNYRGTVTVTYTAN